MRHDFDDGKYTVIFDETSGRMSALRYGDEWRDLCGDKLIYSMLSAYDSTSLEVAQLQARVAELEAAINRLRIYIVGLPDGLTRDHMLDHVAEALKP